MSAVLGWMRDLQVHLPRLPETCLLPVPSVCITRR